jgi:RimJ/RimL family protein N-acetyltransferase
MTPNYFETLLNLRLKHYQKFGFGVHGVWLNGNLIGQCGLQVLDEELDRVECAIFLGKAFTHQGLGTILARYIFQRCKDCGMIEFYGVARPDNPESIALVKKLGGIALGKTMHFNREAIIFRVDLSSKV